LKSKSRDGRRSAHVVWQVLPLLLLLLLLMLLIFYVFLF